MELLGIYSSLGLTGGEYKTRERIQRNVADLRLLAIPTSWGQVAALNPNWDWVYGICYVLPLRFPLLPAIVTRV